MTTVINQASAPQRPGTRMARAIERLWLLVGVLCLVVGVIILAQGWVDYVTATTPRARDVWEAQVPGYDAGLTVEPPTTTQYGYVELWVYPHDGDDIRPLLRLYGVPPLPQRQPRAKPPAIPIEEKHERKI